MTGFLCSSMVQSVSHQCLQELRGLIHMMHLILIFSPLYIVSLLDEICGHGQGPQCHMWFKVSPINSARCFGCPEALRPFHRKLTMCLTL